jgi:hypothetical protein
MEHILKKRKQPMNENAHLALARHLSSLFARFPQVEAIGVSGSLTSGAELDAATDIDLYVFTTALVPLEQRAALIEEAGGAAVANMNLDYWGLGDEWFHKPSGIEVDMLYWDIGWVEETLARVLTQHKSSMGYTTCYWHTLHNMLVLFDRGGWLARQKAWCAGPYPEALRRAIIQHNHAVLREIIPAYLHQVEKAAQRGDLVSVNHRIAAFLASYFDIIFAANGALHPGEKRLLSQAQRLCPSLPQEMAEQIEGLLWCAGQPGLAVAEQARRLLDQLDVWLSGKEKWWAMQGKG